MSDLKDRSLIRNIGLFLVLVVLINGLFLPGSASSTELLTTFYLASFLHAGFTFYDGRFDALRTATWLLLGVAWAGPEIAGFFGYGLIWVQFKFWLVTWLTNLLAALPIAGERLAEWCWRTIQRIGEVPAPSPILLLLLLGFDIAVMHQEAWRKSSLMRIVIFLAAACAGALILGLAVGAITGAAPRAQDMADIGGLPTPPKIVPDWYFLPLYSLLRSIPDKLAGVAVMFAAMAVPLAWPWMRADQLRTGPTRWVWLLLCIAQAAIWICLGYLGSRPPDPFGIQAARVLAVLYFAFFLAWPPLLRRVALKGASDRHR
jgi:quinol-cytochrome oxidoreductase complex cytochrome b subunit